TITPGAVHVHVTTSGGTSAEVAGDQFTYNAVQPAVTSVSPNNGPTGGGTSVTITGTNFISGATVAFGLTPATGVVVNSATSITAVSPATLTPGTIDVRVSTSGGTSPAVAGDQFTYNAVQPAVTSLSPSSGPTGGGTSVTITGTNFIAGASGAFGLAAAASVTVNSPTQTTAVTPSPSPGTVDVTITTTGGTSATSPADQFTFFAIPTVTAVSPNNGPTGGGTPVTISGTNFAPGSTAAFGATAATNVVVVDATTITADPPATLTPGTVDVHVVTSGGTSANTVADDFTYNAVQPAVTSVSPNTGPTDGGTVVTITGTNFINGASVAFGAGAATGVLVNSATSI